MDLEEIQCPLCREQFNEKTRVPLLLPDCGHSYCQNCISEKATLDPPEEDNLLAQGDDDLIGEGNISLPGGKRRLSA